MIHGGPGRTWKENLKDCRRIGRSVPRTGPTHGHAFHTSQATGDDRGMEPQLCPRPLAKDDAAALLGVLAGLQGHALVGDIDPRLMTSLSRRVGGGDGSAGLEAALDGLNQRLRYALGEYDDPLTGR